MFTIEYDKATANPLQHGLEPDQYENPSRLAGLAARNAEPKALLMRPRIMVVGYARAHGGTGLKENSVATLCGEPLDRLERRRDAFFAEAALSRNADLHS